MKPSEKLHKIFYDKDSHYIPRSLWKHHPHEEDRYEDFVQATLDFHTPHAFDVVKITPGSSFGIRDYGCSTGPHALPYGSVTYTPVVKDISQIKPLAPLDPSTGFLGMHASCVKAISSKIASSQILLQTVFSPVAQTINLLGIDLVMQEAERSSEEVWKIIDVLAATTEQFVQLISPYVDGFCYAIQESRFLQHFSQEFLNRYHALNTKILGRFDIIKMVHLHGAVHHFERICKYPIDILHWDEVASGIPLEHGKKKFPGIVSGGIDWPVNGWSHFDEMKEACNNTRLRVGSDRLLLSAGCTIPYQSPFDFIKAFREW